ncbi:MAG: hypothetical protein [Microviridae sp.]|nr:MAG: hypothetical protein [Microviridae sp.]
MAIPSRLYEVYDIERDLVRHEFECLDDDSARKEFSAWFNMQMRGDVFDWETRPLAECFLVHVADVSADGGIRFLSPSRPMMADWEVRLSFIAFRMNDPPTTESEAEACLAEFNRLDALDVARLDDMRNKPSVSEFANGEVARLAR